MSCSTLEFRKPKTRFYNRMTEVFEERLELLRAFHEDNQQLDGTRAVIHAERAGVAVVASLQYVSS